MLASIVWPLVLIAFLNTLMWALGLMSLTSIGYCNFLHVNSVVGFGVGCVVGVGYHGGMNMHGLSACNPNDQTCGLNGGLLSGSIMGELLPSESLSCPPSNAWWAEPPFGTWVSKPLLV